MITLIYGMGFLSLTLSGAIFGFFYAWICSTMWGLDAMDPRGAIAAMQAMNASVRNIVFAPAFFGTGPVLLLTAAIAWRGSQRTSAMLFACAGGAYILGAMLLTMMVNVPMNEALALVAIPEDVAEARAIWDDYSARWQIWNTVRTVVSWAVLMLTGVALASLRSSEQTRAEAR